MASLVTVAFASNDERGNDTQHRPPVADREAEGERMSRKKIAPTLSHIILPKYRGSQDRYIDEVDWPVCAAELRALLAVGRAAQSFEMRPDRLRAALARLARASRREGR